MSRQYFDFSGLIHDFSTEFIVVSHTDGKYDDDGEWQDGHEMQTVMTGAIIAFKESKVFHSEGKLTAKDKRLFMLKALPDALMGSHVIHKGHKYMIESEHENAEFTGVYSYLLKYVSVFDEGGGGM